MGRSRAGKGNRRLMESVVIIAREFSARHLEALLPASGFPLLHHPDAPELIGADRHGGEIERAERLPYLLEAIKVAAVPTGVEAF